MNNLFKNSFSYTFAIISAVFTIVPEAVFKKIMLISKESFKHFTWKYITVSEVNVIINHILFIAITLFIVTIIYGFHLYLRKKVIIKGDNYKIIVEYGDLFKIKNCKKVINFDECFSTNIGDTPSDIKLTSICGQYLKNNPNLDVQSLIYNSQLCTLKSKSKYKSKERYELGRIVPNGEYLLLSFTKLDKKGLARLTRDEYLNCLKILWEEIDTYYGQKDVAIPILGSGLTRFADGSGASISQQELLDLIIWSYKLSSHKIKLPYKLRIICRKSEDFSINNIDSQI